MWSSFSYLPSRLVEMLSVASERLASVRTSYWDEELPLDDTNNNHNHNNNNNNNNNDISNTNRNADEERLLLTSLPRDVLEHIILFLTPEDVFILRTTCSSMHRLYLRNYAVSQSTFVPQRSGGRHSMCNRLCSSGGHWQDGLGGRCHSRWRFRCLMSSRIRRRL